MVIKNKELRKILEGRQLKDVKEVDNLNDCHFVIIKNLYCRKHSLILTKEEYEETVEMEVYNFSTVFFLCWTNPRNVREANRRLLLTHLRCSLDRSRIKKIYQKFIKKNIRNLKKRFLAYRYKKLNLPGKI